MAKTAIRSSSVSMYDTASWMSTASIARLMGPSAAMIGCLAASISWAVMLSGWSGLTVWANDPT